MNLSGTTTRFVLSITALILSSTWEFSAQEAPRLQVATDGRYLQYQDGRPFFYLADTAWELFHRTTRKEADLYLANRAEKGVTVIQAVITPLIGNLNDPNSYGELPFFERDPLRPNEGYFEHVDYIVEKATSSRLFIGLLPTWGSYWKQIGKSEPPVFTLENAREYGRYVGRRYRDQSVIWILGVTSRSKAKRKEPSLMNSPPD